MNIVVQMMMERIDKDIAWRTAWNALANSDRRKGRWTLQTQQEYIEHRAVLANQRVAKLMHDFDEIKNSGSLA